MNTQVQFLEKNGKPEYAVIPIEDYRQLLALAEDVEDINAANRAMDELSCGADELLPAVVIDQLLQGVAPLKVWREYRKMTQELLANAVKVGKSYVSQIEQGRKQGSVRVLGAMAKVLRVDVDDLIA